MAEFDLRDYVMAVRSTELPGTMQGTAFLVSQKKFGYAVTCCHVVGKQEQVELYFEPTGQSIQAKLVSDHSNIDMDIAILELLEQPPIQLKMLHLESGTLRNKKFESYGFPQTLKGLRIKGTVDGLVPSPEEALKTLRDGLFQLSTYENAEGISGAPVVLAHTSNVVGIIVRGYKTKSINLAHLAYAQPIDVILQIWPELGHQLLIRTKSEWLDAVGLSKDPFEYPDGGRDPDLASYYYFSKALYFQEVLGKLETVFVFADSGCGKSAFRNVLAQACLNRDAGHLILPVNYLWLAPLTLKHKKGQNIEVEDHVELLIKEGINAFVRAIRKGVIERCNSVEKEIRDYMWAYVREYGQHLTLAIRNKLKKLLEPSDDAEYSLPEDYADRLSNFCDTVTSLGFECVYFLVDPYASDETEWSVLFPLFVDKRVLDLSDNHGAFKFFLDRHLMDTVRAMPAISTEMVKLSPLEWFENDLHQMVLQRLSAKMHKGKSPQAVLGKMFEKSDSFSMILEESHENPRALVTLFNAVISERCKSLPFDREQVPIPHQLVERVIELLQPHKQEPPSPTLLQAREQHKALAIAKMIAQGESDRVEFKSTMRWNVHTRERDKRMEKTIAGTLSAFMNSEGGTLLIGVDDEGNVLGLADDFSTLRKQDEDGFELALTDIVKSYLGVEYRRYIHVTFVEISGKLICIANVDKSHEPVYLQDGEEREFYVRMGNSTRRLDVKAAISYIRSRWGW
jgi:DNA-binding ferritin-like protein (Dps family)